MTSQMTKVIDSFGTWGMMNDPLKEKKISRRKIEVER